MNDTGAKQQIVDKIKGSSNILVTVSTDPSVDELSAALGLTLLLNKMDKHATAVFSGAVPPAITFLDPQKTFENTVDSLRDFIIALDKEKADHLRYKVDGDVVKIFITPYRTTISSDDLEFSQGDYNVELVLALGVKNQDHLDNALSAHGRILHDATVATIGTGSEKSELGSIEWREENASSLSEILVALTDSLKGGKALLDEQIATAFLTGIVAATDRFSNNKTSSKVMTVAAQLMGAGANQQLIASKLEAAHEIGQDAPVVQESKPVKDENSDGTTDLSEGMSTKLKKKSAKKEDAPEPEEPPKKDDGSLTISHEKKGTLDEVAAQTEEEEHRAATEAAEAEIAKQTEEVPKKNQSEAAAKAEQNLAQQLAGVAPVAAAGTPSVADLQKDLAAASEDIDEAAQQPPSGATQETAAPLSGPVSEDMWKAKEPEGPLMGGTLNATTDQAERDKRSAIEADRNKTILSHGGSYVGDQSPVFQSPLNAAVLPVEEPPMVDPLQDTTPPTPETQPAPEPVLPALPVPPAPQPEPSPFIESPVNPSAPTLADIDQQNRAAPSHDEARAAVHAAFDATPVPEPMPADPGLPGLPPLPPLPDFSTLPPMPSTSGAVDPTLPPETLGETLPPAPDVPAPAKPTDPGQYRIPGQ